MPPRNAFALLLAAALGCGPRATRVEEPPPPRGAPDAGPTEPEEVAPPAETPQSGLYSAREALADALSGPWTHVGTGPWHGIARFHACAYKNDRVLIVNVYCGKKDTRAFRVDVFSPTRGRVRLYAEAESAISPLSHDQYFTFKAESEPAPPPEAGLPRVTLGMSFAELAAYDKRRYDKFMPGCWVGVEVRQPQRGCLGALKSREAQWVAENQDFFERPPPEWYRLVRDLRALAPKHGKHVN